MQNSSDEQIEKVLLVGDIGSVFLDTDGLGKLKCEIHTNLSDATDAVATNNFTIIAVIMSEVSTKLGSALRTLRQADGRARIILLARMYEEPLARKLVESVSHKRGAADDYLICPVSAERFIRYIKPEHAGIESSAAKKGTDRTMQGRIRILEELAVTDELTELKNRRYVWEFGRQIIDYASEQGGRVTLLMFDIDNFKHYNDVYGHAVGDEILKQAAVLIKRCCRGHDVVGRVGGDEFAVVFWDGPQEEILDKNEDRRNMAVDHPREVIFIAQRFMSELEGADLDLLGQAGQGLLTISGGLARYPNDGATIEELFGRADEAMLEAKRSGKNRIYLVGKAQNNIADIH